HVEIFAAGANPGAAAGDDPRAVEDPNAAAGTESSGVVKIALVRLFIVSRNVNTLLSRETINFCAYPVRATAEVRPAPTAVQITGPCGTDVRADHAAGRETEPRLPVCGVQLHTFSGDRSS